MIKFKDYDEEKINESLRIDGITYEHVENSEGELVYVSSIGFLGREDHVIDWDTIIEQYRKIKKV